MAKNYSDSRRKAEVLVAGQPRKLGKTQFEFLIDLIHYESSKGWTYGTPSLNRKLGDALVKRGLARYDGRHYFPVEPKGNEDGK